MVQFSQNVMKDDMTVKISFTGDVMCEHTRLKDYLNEHGAYEFDSLFSGCKDLFSESDYVVANLETPVAGEELKYSYRYYNFNTPESILKAMKNNGIDAVTTANNHALDRGIEGLNKTIENIRNASLDFTGTADSEDASRPLIKNIGGIRFAFLSYTYGTEACYNKCYLKRDELYRVNLLRNQELSSRIKRHFVLSKSYPMRAARKLCKMIAPGKIIKNVEDYHESDKRQLKRLLSDIAYAKENADVVIMCLHSGGQFNDAPTAYTKKTADICFDAGVDFIVGNHEHVVQGSDFSSGRKIAYCLGNFTSNYSIDRGPYDKNVECSVLLHLYVCKNGDNYPIEESFSVMISLKGVDGKITTIPLYDAFETADEKARLIQANTKCVNSFLGTSFEKVLPEKEYKVSDLIDISKKEIKSC